MKAILLGHLIRTGIAFAFIIIIFAGLDFLSRPDADPTIPLHETPRTIAIPDDSAGAIIGQQERPVDGYSSGSLAETSSDYSLLTAWLKFFLVYALNLSLLYYGVLTFGLVRFIRSRQHRRSFTEELRTRWNRFIRIHSIRNFLVLMRFPAAHFLKTILWMILFTPAYVAAYSFKTNFNTDSLIFMIGLGCLTNGILVMYAQKFFQLLTAEYRKGYVETALTLEAENNFSFSPHGALSWKRALSPVKHFAGHTLAPVYENARMQYLSAFREQASFLITCMIIIEMALNMHGYLGYELLRRLLFRDYFAAAALICGVFLIVKATEIYADYLIHSVRKRHAND